MKQNHSEIGVSRQELMETLAAISLITKDLTQKLAKHEKGRKDDGKGQDVYRINRKPTRML